MLHRTNRYSGVGIAVLAALSLCPVCTPALAEGDSLTNLSLEQLMNEPITTVSKRETRLGSAAAAVTVITADEIRRLGITSLPEALRLVPGMQVARVNSHTWAVSARGFQSRYAHKLLVMIDGRTVYEPTYAGVDWASQDVMLEDLDHIEVIRGPGATLWGANAVNGVVNIITKKSADTLGLIASTAVSSEDRPAASARYGWNAGDADYRVYMKYFDRKGLVDATGADVGDDWSMVRAGFRGDWTNAQGDFMTLQGDAFRSHRNENITEARLTPPYLVDFVSHDTDTSGNVLGRWTHTLESGSELSVQSFFNRSQLHLFADGSTTDTFDLELQHHFAVAERHDVVWGSGYRLIDDRRHSAKLSTMTPMERRMQLFTGFVQDEIALIPDRWQLTLGFKLEHNDQTGVEVQPGVRLAFTPASNLTWWASASRAVRTPGRFERDGEAPFITFPGDDETPTAQLVMSGNPNVDAEHLLAYESGVRIEPVKGLSLDIALFYDDYDGIIDFSDSRMSLETTPLPYIKMAQYASNDLDVASYGGEVALRWKVTDWMQLDAAYSRLHLTLPSMLVAYDGPKQTAQLRGLFSLPHDFEMSGALYYNGEIQSQAIDSNLRADLAVLWHPTSSMEAGVWGQNLLESRHAELQDQNTFLQTYVPRSFGVKVTQRF